MSTYAGIAGEQAARTLQYRLRTGELQLPKYRYVVKVTELDCSLGVRGNSHYCVVQTALERLIPTATHFDCTATTIRFTLPEGDKRVRLVYPTPLVVAGYIRDFDQGSSPKPMEFVLENPQVAEAISSDPRVAKTVTFKPSRTSKSGRSTSRRIWGEHAYREAVVEK